MALELLVADRPVSGQRVVIHLVAALLLAAFGAYVFSYHAFSLFFPGQSPPFALLVGMATGLMLMAIPLLAGFGLRMLVDSVVRRKPIQPRDLFDLLVTTQYFTAGLVLVGIHYAIR